MLNVMDCEYSQTNLICPTLVSFRWLSFHSTRLKETHHFKIGRKVLYKQLIFCYSKCLAQKEKHLRKLGKQKRRLQNWKQTVSLAILDLLASTKIFCSVWITIPKCLSSKCANPGRKKWISHCSGSRSLTWRVIPKNLVMCGLILLEEFKRDHVLKKK